MAKYDWQFGPGGVVSAIERLGPVGRTEVDDIDVPVLALVGLGEDPESMRQARAVIDAVGRRHPSSSLVVFDRWTGADAHCQVGNLPLAMHQVTWWLDERYRDRPLVDLKTG